MHIIQPSYTHTLHHVVFDPEKDQENFKQMFAVLFAFKLDNPSTLIQIHELFSQLNPLLEQYQYGLDEGFAKKNPEFVVFGKNIPSETDTNTQVVEVSVNGKKKQLAIFPKRHWVKSSFTKFDQEGDDNVESILISYQNAFGGQGFKNNPIGQGFLNGDSYNDANDDKLQLPQIMPVGTILNSAYEKIKPLSFSQLPVDSKIKTQYSGKYTKEQEKTLARTPTMPKGTKDEYFQITPEDQWVSSLDGEISYSVKGMSKEPIEGKSPKIKAVFHSRKNKTQQITQHQGKVDSFLLFPNENIGIVTTRFVIYTNHLDIDDSSYLVQLDEQGVLKRSNDANYEAFNKRFSNDRHLYGLKEDDLMPMTHQPTEQEQAGNSLKEHIDQLNAEQSEAFAGFDENFLNDDFDDKPSPKGVQGLIDSKSKTYNQDQALESLHYESLYNAHSADSVDSITLTLEANDQVESYLLETRKGKNWQGLNIQGITIKEQELKQLNAQQTTFSTSTLNQAAFESSILTESQILSCKLNKVTFTKSNMIKAEFGNSEISNSEFIDLNLSKAQIVSNTFTDCLFEQCIFNQAMIKDNIFKNCQFNNCVFNEAVIYNNDFNNSKFTQSQFEKATISIIDFSQTSFNQDNFKKATLDQVNFTNCKFDKIKSESSGFQDTISFIDSKFIDCEINGTNFMDSTWDKTEILNGTWSSNIFTQAKLKAVSFNQTNMHDNNFVMAKIEDSKFNQVDFTSSNWTGLMTINTQISSCKLEGVIMAYAELESEPV